MNSRSIIRVATVGCEGKCVDREPFVLPTGCPPAQKPRIPDVLVCKMPILKDTKLTSGQIHMTCPIDPPSLELSGPLCGTFDVKNCQLQLKLKTPQISVTGTCGVSVRMETTQGQSGTCADRKFIVSAKTVKVTPTLEYDCNIVDPTFENNVESGDCEIDNKLTLKLPKPVRVEIGVSPTCGGEPTVVTSVENCTERYNIKIPKPPELKLTMEITCCKPPGLYTTPLNCGKEIRMVIPKPPKMHVDVLQACGIEPTQWVDCLTCGKIVHIAIPKPSKKEYVISQGCYIPPGIWTEPISCGERIHIRIPQQVQPRYTAEYTCIPATKPGLYVTRPVCEKQLVSKTINYAAETYMLGETQKETCSCGVKTTIRMPVLKKLVIQKSKTVQYETAICTSPTIKLVIPKARELDIKETCFGSSKISHGLLCTDTIVMRKHPFHLDAVIGYAKDDEEPTVTVYNDDGDCAEGGGFSKTVSFKIPKVRQLEFSIEEICSLNSPTISQDKETKGVKIKLPKPKINLNVSVGSGDELHGWVSGPTRCDLLTGELFDKTIKINIPGISKLCYSPVIPVYKPTCSIPPGEEIVTQAVSVNTECTGEYKYGEIQVHAMKLPNRVNIDAQWGDDASEHPTAIGDDTQKDDDCPVNKITIEIPLPPEAKETSNSDGGVTINRNKESGKYEYRYGFKIGDLESTFKQWIQEYVDSLHLTGEKGDPGEKGDKGDPGPPGECKDCGGSGEHAPCDCETDCPCPELDCEKDCPCDCASCCPEPEPCHCETCPECPTPDPCPGDPGESPRDPTSPCSLVCPEGCSCVGYPGNEHCSCPWDDPNNPDYPPPPSGSPDPGPGPDPGSEDPGIRSRKKADDIDPLDLEDSTFIIDFTKYRLKNIRPAADTAPTTTAALTAPEPKEIR